MLLAESEFPSFLIWFLPLDLIVTGAIVFLVLRTARNRRQKLREILQTWAGELGLEVVDSSSKWKPPMLRGIVAHRTVEFHSFTTGSGKSQQTWVACDVTPDRATSLTFSLSRQNVFHKVGQWLGLKEVKIGDEAFDQMWFIRTNQPDFLRAALVPELRQRILQAVNQGASGRFETHEGKIRYVQAGNFSQEKARSTLTQLLPLVIDLAILSESAGEA